LPILGSNAELLILGSITGRIGIIIAANQRAFVGSLNTVYSKPNREKRNASSSNKLRILFNSRLKTSVNSRLKKKNNAKTVSFYVRYENIYSSRINSSSNRLRNNSVNSKLESFTSSKLNSSKLRNNKLIRHSNKLNVLSTSTNNVRLKNVLSFVITGSFNNSFRLYQ